TLERSREVRNRIGRRSALIQDAQRIAKFLDGSQIEFVQIDTDEGQEEPAAANVGGAHDHLMRQLILDSEVEVVGSGCTLRVQHSAQGYPQVVGQTGRR